MRLRKVAEWTGKAAVSAILAFLALTAFCYFYENTPPAQPIAGGATDYTHLANVFWSNGREGMAWGRNNNEGYNDLLNYTPGMKVDVLIMGSSHVEAFQVGMRENMTYELQKKLPGKTVYNIGISGEEFMTRATNLSAAIKKYHPEYLVLETQSVLFERQDLEDAVTRKYKEGFSEQSQTRSGWYQKFPLLVTLRLFPKVLSINLKDLWQKPETVQAENSLQNDEELLDRLLAGLQKEGQAGDAQIIIMYHPHMELQPDGSLTEAGSRIAVQQFQSLCEKNGICFLDMSERFQAEYAENHVLPHGFSNTSVGSGHLNKYGHAMIADELSKIIGGAA